MADDDDEGGGEGWIVSFADLMTLLFATFVVLYGLKPEGESDSVLGVVSSIREAFVEIPDEIPEDERKGPIHKGIEVFKYFKGDQMRRPVVKRYRRSENMLNIINRDMEQMKKVLDLMTGRKEQGIGADPKKSWATVDKSEDGFRVRLIASVLYGPGEYRLSQENMKNVRMVGKLLKDLDKRVTIEGHTDPIPAKGELSNWDISTLRATHLLHYFISELQYPADKLSAAGYADTKPIAPNNTPEGRRLNRRIEIKVHYEDLDVNQ